MIAEVATRQMIEKQISVLSEPETGASEPETAEHRSEARPQSQRDFEFYPALSCHSCKISHPKSELQVSQEKIISDKEKGLQECFSKREDSRRKYEEGNAQGQTDRGRNGCSWICKLIN